MRARPTASDRPEAPGRYELETRLGGGAGGEVWAARDRVSGARVALKVLHPGASQEEVLALVREATALSAIEGLGVPRVLRFGRLGERGGPAGEGGGPARVGERAYLVRELVEGESLADRIDDPKTAASDLLRAIARAGDQLTALHRSDLLHGDVKPANVVVGEGGRTTLVDLGLAAKLRAGGSRAMGLTPRYAAPELLAGGPITVRAEVFALGATIADVLRAKGAEMAPEARAELEAIAARATASSPEARFPSTDELATAVRRAAALPADAPPDAWPLSDVEGTAAELLRRVRGLRRGGGLIVAGPAGSGRTSLLRRTAWELGVEGQAVIWLEGASEGGSLRALELEIEGTSERDVAVLVDDAGLASPPVLARLRALREAGARLVAVADAGASLDLGPTLEVLVVPALADGGERIVRARAPGLGDQVVARIVARAEGRPGPLRSILAKLAGRPIASPADVDEALDASAPSGRVGVQEVHALLDRGRFEEAADQLAEIDGDSPWIAIARARVATNRGDAKTADRELRAVEAEVVASPDRHLRAAFGLHLARALLRMGDHEGAADRAAGVELDAQGDPASGALVIEALATLGLSESFLGRQDAAEGALSRSVALAREAGDPRSLSLSLGSLGFVLQRAERLDGARAAYEEALRAAEEAGDAGSVATTRLNLATIAKTQGDLAGASVHLEGAADMGRRSGRLSTLRHALSNLANLDLYLGRFARARSSIEMLGRERDELSPQLQAHLLALEAEQAGREGKHAEAAERCVRCAEAYEALGRGVDAAEARLEGVLALAAVGAPPAQLAAEIALAERLLGTADAHGALAAFARAKLDLARGRDDQARESLGAALEAARAHGQRDWIWRTLEARAALDEGRGSNVRAARDREEALAVLEEIAMRLPSDLREVFWSDPRRASLQVSWARPTSIHGAAPTDPSARELGAPRDDRTNRILEINRAIAGESHLPRLLEKITDHAVALSRAERGFVILRSGYASGETDAGSPGDGRLSVHAAHEAPDHDEGSIARFSRSIADRVLETGEPIVTASAREDERLGGFGSVHQLMLQSVACVPIRARSGVPIGALYLETRQRPEKTRLASGFAAELPTLLALADQVAIAIETARLLGENERRRTDLLRANGELEKARARLEELLGQRTSQLQATRRDLRTVRAVIRGHFGYGGLVGTSEAMRKLYALVDRVKDTDVPVLITGESGTGKEIVARAIHDAGPRAKKQFVGINCGAIPEHLLESELFGHVRGAFTGADRERHGLFREASEGTLLLDEIGEMPPRMQATLLRVLQEKTVRPVGGTKESPVATRVIAATHRDLAQMVSSGAFREDLFYRLDVIHLRVPPLRERPEDVPLLVDHFLGIFAARYGRERRSVSRDALRVLTSQPWPGNVRQLENVLLNAWVLGEEDELELEDFDLPRGDVGKSPRSDASPPTSLRAHKDGERGRILAALEACNWNRAAAAKKVGLPRRTFYRRLKEYGIQ